MTMQCRFYMFHQGFLWFQFIQKRVNNCRITWGLWNLENVQCSIVEWKILPVLEPFQKSHAQVFEDMNLLSSETFKWPCDRDYVFPSATKRAKQPWMARQPVSLAVGRILEAMYRLTGTRRWNSDFKGWHVTVHGATRHTASALLLAPPEHGRKVPSEHVIMEIQQRHDNKTFRRHFCDAQDDEVAEALEQQVNFLTTSSCESQEMHIWWSSHKEPLKKAPSWDQEVGTVHISSY